jgi:hypothetical protein
VVGAALIITSLVGTCFTEKSLCSDVVAHEIGYIHNEQINLEVNTGSLDDARSYLSKLDFPDVASPRKIGSCWVLGTVRLTAR